MAPTRVAELLAASEYRALVRVGRRFWLARTWDKTAPRMAFVMLNPSIADSDRDDPTIRRCVGFADRERCGGIVVANLFSHIATDPRDLPVAKDYLRQLQDDVAIRLATAHHDGPVVAAWGAHAPAWRARQVMAQPWATGWLCFGVTKGGQPRHPLMLRADTPLVPYQSAGE